MWKTTDSVFAQSLHDTRLPGHPVVVAQDFILSKLRAHQIILESAEHALVVSHLQGM